MNRTLAVGLGLSALGVAGYLLGIVRPSPGRAFSIAAVMIGMGLLSVGMLVYFRQRGVSPGPRLLQSGVSSLPAVAAGTSDSNLGKNSLLTRSAREQ